MSAEDELRRQLLAASDTYYPDTERIRARFDVGVAAALRARRVGVHQAGPPRHRQLLDMGSRTGPPRARLRSSALATALTAVVVCGVTAAVQDATRHGPDPGPAHFADPPVVTSGTATPAPSSPVPTPAPPTAPSSPVRTPAPPSPTARPGRSAAPSTLSPPAAPARPGIPPVPGVPGVAGAPGVPGVAGPLASPANQTAPAAQVTRCGPYDSVATGSFMIDNNLWAAGRGTGTQCVQTAPGAATSISWSSTWDWSGGPGQTKSFASAVLGWRWGYQPGPGAGLPVQLSDHHAIRTHWAYTLTQSRAGDLDVAYDMWLHTTPHPGTTQPPAAEMRVVLDKIPAGPVGSSSLGTVTVDGTTWNLYSDSIGWTVYSFVRSTPATGPVDLNLTDFTDALVGLGRLAPALSVTSVQAGVDAIDGAGTLATSAYSVTIG